MKVGQYVLYVDADGTTRDALVTAVWTDDCVNLAYALEDGSLVTVTSIPRQGTTPARYPTFRSGLGDDLRFLREGS